MKRDEPINRGNFVFKTIALMTFVGFCGLLVHQFLQRQKSAPESTSNPTPIHSPKSPLSDAPLENQTPSPPEKLPERSLEKRRGNQARKWWNAWKVAYPAELDKNLAKLSGKLQLSSLQKNSVLPLFQKEETYWIEYLDKELEPVFQKGESPDFRAMMNQSYHALVDRICADTDMQIRALLSREQWDLFQSWREKYNQDRYYWSEGSPRD